VRKLLQALALWEGPSNVAQEIERRSLLIPQIYRQSMLKYCESCRLERDLDIYWSECSKEYVFSGGRADSRRRRFAGEAPYRSCYLDELAESADAQPGQHLHPCLRRWQEEDDRSGGQLSRASFEHLEELKIRERERHYMVHTGPMRTKRDVKSILRYYAERNGYFEEHLSDRGFSGSGNAFCKKTKSRLLFYCWVDEGGFPEVSGRLPIMFFVSHQEDTFPPMGAGPDSIYVGSEYYARFKTSENAILGIFALVEIFDSFFATFSRA
jgi:hypothetical protein